MPVVSLPQSPDGFEEYPAMTDRTNADFFQVLLRQVQEDPFAYFVLAECGLVLFEAELQPTQSTMSMMAPELRLGA